MDWKNIQLNLADWRYKNTVRLNKKITRKTNNNSIETGSISDTYHTFDELYNHRCILFSVICNQNKHIAWKSKKHDDGTMYDGMFIVGIKTPMGQATYHYDLDNWGLFDVKELKKAPKWDGHTPEDVLERLQSLK